MSGSSAILTDDTLPSGAEDPGTWRERYRRSSPPLIFLAAALVAVPLLHLALAIAGIALGPWIQVALDLAVIAAAAAAGVWARRQSASRSVRPRWLSWEDAAGTSWAVVILWLAVIVAVLVWWNQPAWWGLLLGGALTAVIAHALAYPRPSSEEPLVVPDQQTPEPIEDYLRVSLPWDLAPASPETKGEISTWIRRDKVAEFRPPKNPKTNWVTGSDGTPHPAFEWYVHEGACQEVNNLADQIAEITRVKGLSRYAELCLVLDLVQSIEYRHDDDPRFPEETRFGDYWRFPIETLADQAGDCEDSAILTVSLLSALGHRSCFFDLPGHAAVGVTDLPEGSGVYQSANDGAWFYYTETTNDGWAIGELPDNVKKEELRISAVVEPLRARQPDPPLPRMPRGHWRRESLELVGGLAGLAIAGGLIAYSLSAWS